MYISSLPLLAATTLLSLASALPQAAPSASSNSSAAAPPTNLNINQLRASNRVSQAPAGTQVPGPVALANAYAKYGKTAPANVLSAAIDAKKTTSTATATVQSGAVSATPIQNDQLYLVPVTVGKTQMMLDLDTGSSDFWVFSNKLTSQEEGSHALYKLGGKKVAGESWGISYGDGSSADGIVYADKVQIGPVTATSVEIEVATYVSSSFTNGYPDGLIGLGFPIGNTCGPNRCTPFFTNISSTLPSPIFAANLKHNAPGSFDFGFIDPTAYTGSLAYAPVNDNLGGGYWEFNSGGYAIGNSSKKSRTMDTIADTGTSLTLADDVIVSAYYADIPSTVYNSTYGAYIFACNESSSLPSLSYYMGGQKHTMPGAYGVYGTVAEPEGYCYGGVQSNDALGFTILGDTFLKSQYVVFDMNPNKPRIGFAQQAGVVY